MIVNGNYEWFDYEANKHKLANAATVFYGEDKRDIIEHKLDRTIYVPYHKIGDVFRYYQHYFKQHNDEIMAEIKSRLGSGYANCDLGTDAYSLVSGLNMARVATGLDLEKRPFNQSVIEEIIDKRIEVCKKFGLEYSEESMEKLHEISKAVKSAYRDVLSRYACDVTRDVYRYSDNKLLNTQAFLTTINKYNINLHPNDVAVISKPDMTSFDLDRLHSEYVYYGADITEPGLIEAFTTAKRKASEQDKDEMITMYIDRIFYFMAVCDEVDLKYIDREEIFKSKTDEEFAEFSERVLKEYFRIVSEHPDLMVSPATADAIEANRKSFLNMCTTGCRFAEFVNQSYLDGTQAREYFGDQPEWTTYAVKRGQNIFNPWNIIFFNESLSDSREWLLYSLSHELNHALSHGNIIMSHDGKKAFAFVGIEGGRIKVRGGHYADDYDYSNEKDKDINVADEDINDRMGIEIAKIFEDMYGNPFSQSDYKDEKLDMSNFSIYSRYDFMLHKLYTQFKEEIKNFVIGSDGKIFYDLEGVPMPNGLMEVLNNIRFWFEKNLNPKKTASRGFLSRRYTEKLGALLSEFKDSPDYNWEIIGESDEFDPHVISGRNLEEFRGKIDDSVLDKLIEYKDRAEDIVDKMIRERDDIYTRAGVIPKVRRRRPKDYYTSRIKSKVGDVIDNIKKKASAKLSDFEEGSFFMLEK